MGKKLVIVESPAKAKTINKILGGDFIVRACMGHIRDLPKSELGIAIKKNFLPKYETTARGKKTVAELKKALAPDSHVFLAPDPDREGEAIAWHLKTALSSSIPKGRFFRVKYNEITPPAIRAAFDNPAELDMNMVDSQQARRLLDRIVGYMVSPLLWSNIRRGLSAGRVQSVALRLVCEREAKITAFVPEPYWVMGARVRKKDGLSEPFDTALAKINGEKADIKSAEKAEQIKSDIEGRAFRVSKLSDTELKRRPYPPLITSTLQQAAHGLGFSPSRVMAVAQKLYEGIDLGKGAAGLITYMRTDSVSVSADAVRQCRSFIKDAYGENFLPPSPNVYRNKASSQEAHEAIRPTDVSLTPEAAAGKLAPDELKVYRLVWQRFVASQMAPARIARRTAEILAAPPAGRQGEYLFRATASTVVFPGYMRVLGLEKSATDAQDDKLVEKLPDLAEGEELDLLELLCERKETQPPNRYNEASLVKALEEFGVGRPSTYAQIMETILKRGYVVREKKALQPTELGVKVNEFLSSKLDELFDVKFTAGMEEALDEIGEGKIPWTDMLQNFYSRFEKWVEPLKSPPADNADATRALGVFDGFSAWTPQSGKGKRVFNDAKFVESIRKQFEQDHKPLSAKQVDALLRIAAKYASADAGIRERMEQAGYDPEKLRPAPPARETLRKLDLLEGIELPQGEKSEAAFVDSLRQQAKSGKALSPKQKAALDTVVLNHSAKINNFESLREELGLVAAAPAASDAELKKLMDMLDSVKKWRPAIVRGRWKWDDHKFFESLRRQFAQKGSLSPKQAALLRKMTARYKEQIPNYQPEPAAGRPEQGPSESAAGPAGEPAQPATDKTDAESTA